MENNTKENWVSKRIIVKEDRVVVKRYNKDRFIKSVIIPTVMYPLPNDKDIRVFHGGNCEAITDEEILRIFDAATYKVGDCYRNTFRLAKSLRKAGYDAKTYAGWVFINERQLPVSHAWVVIDNSVLDLTDDMDLGSSWKAKHHFTIASAKDYEEYVARFYGFLKKSDIKNSVRCGKVGVTGIPSVDGEYQLLYVGCEAQPIEAGNFFEDLYDTFPYHETLSPIEANGKTKVQNVMIEALKK